MITDADIQQFTKKARSLGFTESQIAAEIERKKKKDQELASRINKQDSIALSTTNQSQTKPKNKAVDFIGKAADFAGKFLVPRTTQFIKTVTGAVQLGTFLDKINEENEKIYEQSRILIKQAMEATDPEEKKRFLQQSRDLGDRASQNIESVLSTFEKQTGISREIKEMPSYVAQGAGVAGEIGSWLIPGKVLSIAGKGARMLPFATKTSNIASRILYGAAGGATTGFMTGATTPQDLSLKERAQKAGEGALAGGAISGALGTAFELPRTVIKKFITANESRIYQLFKIQPSERAQFRKSTGDMDFAEEILTRDAKNLTSKGYYELLDYFNKRKEEAYKAVHNILDQSNVVIDRKIIEQKIKEKIKQLAPKEGNIGQSGAVRALQNVLSDLQKNPNKLTLSTANTIKRQLQEVGDSAFSVSGSPTPASSAIAELSSFVKGLIEKVAPEVKEGNRLVQLYHTARSSIERTGDREANKLANDIFGQFLHTFPAAVGGVAGGAIGGVPMGFGGVLAGMILSGVAGNARRQFFTPEVQTQIIKWLEPIARSQRLNNADKWAQFIVQETAKIFIRQTGAGINLESTSQGFREEPITSEVGATGIISTTEPQISFKDELVEIRNTETGEVRSVPRSELRNYNLDPDDDSDIPSKQTILAAMFADMAETGGKNLTKLNTLLTAYNSVYKENKLSAQEKSSIREATGGLNLVDSIETMYSELQGLGLAAKRGGLIERGRAAVSGNIASITQEGKRGAAAAAYADTTSAFLAKLARASGEKGVLTDPDVERIKRALPKFSDSPETAQRKLNTIRKIISAAIQSKTESPLGEDEDLDLENQVEK